MIRAITFFLFVFVRIRSRRRRPSAALYAHLPRCLRRPVAGPQQEVSHLQSGYRSPALLDHLQKLQVGWDFIHLMLSLASNMFFGFLSRVFLICASTVELWHSSTTVNEPSWYSIPLTFWLGWQLQHSGSNSDLPILEVTGLNAAGFFSSFLYDFFPKN